MKIIVPNLPISVFFDMVQCLETIKNSNKLEPLFWDTQLKSMMDVFDEARPNIIFLHESQLDNTFNIIGQEFNFKYVLFTTNPNLLEKITKQPDLILTYPTVNHHFQQSTIVNIKPVTKVAQIHNAKYDPKLKSEVLVNTNHVQINDNVQEILNFLINNYQTKIIGEQPVPFHNYLGQVDIFERANFIKSAKVVVDLGFEDCLDAAYLKTPSLCAHPINDVILQFNSTASLKSQIDSLLNSDLVKTSYIQQCYELASKNTTYHLAADIFKAINENAIATALSKYIKELI